MPIQYPEIRFKYPWLLLKAIDPELRPAYREIGKEHVLDEQFIKDRLATFKRLWKSEERQILEGLCHIFGIEFRQNIIDLYVAPFRNSFSDPLTIAAKTADERVVDMIAHELLHRLLSENMASDDSKWERLFGDHPKLVLNHIVVHAGLQALWSDVLQTPERLARDKQKSQELDGYRQAWEYVDMHGYQNIIQKVKESFEADA